MPGSFIAIMAAAGGQHAVRFGHAKRLGYLRIERRPARVGHRGDQIRPAVRTRRRSLLGRILLISKRN